MRQTAMLFGACALLMLAGGSAEAFMGAPYAVDGKGYAGPVEMNARVVWIPGYDPGMGTFLVRLTAEAAPETGAYTVFEGAETYTNHRWMTQDGCSAVEAVDYAARDTATGGSVFAITGVQELNHCTGVEHMRYTGTYLGTYLVLEA